MSGRSDDGGYISLAVLVVTGLLAVIVTSLVMVSRPAMGLARVGVDEAAADALVDGGLRAAGYMLFVARRDYDKVSGTIVRLDTGSVDRPPARRDCVRTFGTRVEDGIVMVQLPAREHTPGGAERAA
jgi:hypothetical protein